MVSGEDAALQLLLLVVVVIMLRRVPGRADAAADRRDNG